MDKGAMYILQLCCLRQQLQAGVLLLHCPLTHPNLRPFITFLGVALACLLARGPRWFARDELEQTWIKPN
ncbi:hypothetical protein S83_005743 [Arachis hypogaea]